MHWRASSGDIHSLPAITAQGSKSVGIGSAVAAMATRTSTRGPITDTTMMTKKEKKTHYKYRVGPEKRVVYPPMVIDEIISGTIEATKCP